MALTLYDSIGDQTLSIGVGALVGQNLAPNPRYAPPITGFAGDVQSGVNTAIRIESLDGGTWEVCESVPVLSAGIFTYSRGTLLKSSTGARITFASGPKLIRFVAPAEAFVATQGNYVDATDDLTMQAGYTYLADDPDDRVLFALPTPAAGFGSPPITIVGYNLGGWQITQRAGEQITISGDTTATTTGTGHGVESTNINDSITLYPIGGGIYNAVLNGGQMY